MRKRAEDSIASFGEGAGVASHSYGQADMMITEEELREAFAECWRGRDKRLAAGGASSSEAGPPADP